MVCVIIRNIKGMGRYFTALLTKEEFWERGRGISTRNCLPHVWFYKITIKTKQNSITSLSLINLTHHIFLVSRS